MLTVSKKILKFPLCTLSPHFPWKLVWQTQLSPMELQKFNAGGKFLQGNPIYVKGKRCKVSKEGRKAFSISRCWWKFQGTKLGQKIIFIALLVHFCALINFYDSACAMNGRFSFSTHVSHFHLASQGTRKCTQHSHTSFRAFCTSKKRWQHFSRTKLDSPKGFREKGDGERGKVMEEPFIIIFYYWHLCWVDVDWKWQCTVISRDWQWVK